MSLKALQDNAVKKFESKKQREGRFSFDPAVILVIAEMVVSFVEIFEDCQNPFEATQIANDPTWLQERLVRLRARRLLGWREYRKVGDDVVEAVLAAGKEVTEDQMARAYLDV